MMRASRIKRLVISIMSIAPLAVFMCCMGRDDTGAKLDAPGVDSPTEGVQRVRVLGVVPHFRLDSQAGKQFGAKELDGKVWIATFIFTSCNQTCPMQMAELARMQDELSDHPDRADIHFVGFSVDPVHDTPAALRAYAARFGADPERWTLLTGAPEAIRTLSRDQFKLPVSNINDPDSLITHSQSFILVDRARRIRGYYDALDASERERLIHDLRIVLEDPPGPITAPAVLERPLKLEGSRAYVPWEIRDPPWMAERAEAQARTVDRFRVFHAFSFTDRLPQSDITFRHRIVDDAGKHYKGVHYDHGTGVAIADVDGDGLQDIYFVNQLGPSQLARNLGGGRFEDFTERAGVAVGDRVTVSASFADIDNDGDPDLYVTAVRDGNLLFENDGTGRFRDISRSAGLDYRGHSSSAVFFDFDRDGLLDMFLANVGKYTTEEIGAGGYHVGFKDAFFGHLRPERSEQSLLFRNIGGNRFVDVSELLDLAPATWSGAASPIDANEDGWTDLFVLNMQGHSEYYENIEGERFVRRSRQVFPRTPWGSMGIKTLDFDNDEHMDIFITDMHTDMVDELEHAQRFWYAEKMKMTNMYPARLLNTDGNHILGNAFFKNDGKGRFREISDEIGAENYWPWGLSVGDLNADGYEDAFIVASMSFPYRYGVNSLLLNNRGEEFLDSEFILGVEPRREGRTSTFWFNLDCDGEDREHLGCKGLGGKIECWGALGSRSSAIFDLDGDGDLDIVTNDFNSEPMVLVSNLMEKKADVRYLAVNLVGTESNRSGLGARVRARCGGQTFTRVQDGQSGHLSQSLVPLYFGLGDAAQVDEIEIRWPSGRTQVLAGPIEPNQVLTIIEE